MSRTKPDPQMAQEAPQMVPGGVLTPPEAQQTPEAVQTPQRVRNGNRMDAEIQCMARVDRLLADLSPEAARRVIRWLDSRYRPSLQTLIAYERNAPHEEAQSRP